MTENAVSNESKTVVLTSENAAEFYAKKLDLTPEIQDAEVVEEHPEKESQEEHPENETKEEKEEEEKPRKKTAKGNVPVSERIATYAQQRREAEQKAQEAEQRALAAEQKAKELEEKLNPPKVDPTGKPDPSTYTDAFKYAEDLAKWSTENTLKERDRVEKEAKEKERQASLMDSWKQKLEVTKTEMEDYEDVVSNSQTVVSKEVRDAILESDVGPKILYYLAQNPEVGEKMKTMTLGQAYKELGRIEAKLEIPAKKVETKAEVEISKAPEPITPLNGGKGVTEVPINRQGEFTGDYQQWKALRKAGKIH